MPELSPLQQAIAGAVKDRNRDPFQLAYELTKSYAESGSAVPGGVPNVFQLLFSLFSGIEHTNPK